MTSTIKKILGNNPTSEEIKREFQKRGLSSKLYLIICEKYVSGNALYAVHGHHSTESSTPEDAMMKFVITDHEIAKNDDIT